MRKVLFSIAASALLVAVVGCQQDDNSGSMKSMKMSDDKPVAAMPTTMPMKTMYTCTMHPEVVSDMPGKCPKCGMELVEKK